MKQKFGIFYALTLLLTSGFLLSSCSLFEGVFKAGMGVGIGVVVLVIALIIFIVVRLGRRS